MAIIDKLQKRGCVHDASHLVELSQLLKKESITFYCGFDPTSDSLQAGNMVPLLIMRRLQEAGHKPIILLGSATGMIGDPSGKSEERKLLDDQTLQKNISGLEKQLKIFLSDKGSNAYQLVKNSDWLNSLSMIEFLRDVGKHITVNYMIAKDSVKSRLESREQGISYTEFSYMLLQGYDFYWLNKNMNCRLQVGGSDQWGNITAGLDLIRKKNPDSTENCFGLTFPLLTTSTGAKFGKTEKGTIWLNKEKTSVYNFYQYWYNTTDEDVIKYILIFTPCEGDELEDLKKSLKEQPEKRQAQQYLATYLTTFVHGEAETKKALQASRVLFGEKIDNIDAKTLLEIFAEVPSTALDQSEISSGLSLTDLLVRCNISKSKGEARRLIEGGGIYLNNEKNVNSNEQITLINFIGNSVLVIRSGKKNYHLLQLS